MKRLFIIIKMEYLEQIEAGTKPEEFRLNTPYWRKKLVGKEYTHILFQAGYRPEARRLEVVYKGYEQRTIQHEFFGSAPVEVFAIKVGEIV